MVDIEQLIQATREGELEVVKQIISEDASLIEAQNHEGETALLHAAWNGKLEVVKFLLECGAKVDAQSHKLMTPLMAAASYGYHKTVRYLLENGANINLVSKSEKTALIYASVDWNTAPKYFECVQVLVEYAADVNHQDDNGKTALMHTKNPQIFEFLYNKTINFELADKEGNTFLLLLCKNLDWKKLDILKKLVAKGININTVNKDKNSVLDFILNSSVKEQLKIAALKLIFTVENNPLDPQLASQSLDSAIAEKTVKNINLLLQIGVKPNRSQRLQLICLAHENNKVNFNIQDYPEIQTTMTIDEESAGKDGNTLLLNSLQTKKWELALSLIPFSNVNAKNNQGKTLLQLALKHSHEKCIRALAAAGADINEFDSNNENLLMRHIHDVKLAKLLIDLGADVDSISKRNGSTVLIQAAKIHADSTVEAILKRKPSNINVKDNNGRTALFTAVFNSVGDLDYVATVKHLIAAEADPYIPGMGGAYKELTVFDMTLQNSAFSKELNELKKKIDLKTTKLSKAQHAVSFKHVETNTVSETENGPSRSLPGRTNILLRTLF